MRITGGELGRRRLASPRGDALRPTQERVREALFSSLADRLAGARFLDLYAGTGAVGLEAWSRGAAEVVWVESHPRVLKVLRENVRGLTGSPGAVVGADVLTCLRRGPTGGPFDVVFADPPYDRGGADLAAALMGLLRAQAWLAPGGLFVLELAAGGAAPAPDAGWALQADKHYGRTRLVRYRRTDERDGAGAGTTRGRQS